MNWTRIGVVLGALAFVGVVIAATSGVPTTGTIVVSSTNAPDVGIAGGKDITFGDLGPDGETHANISNQGLLTADGDANGNLTVPAGESLDGSPVRVEEISTSGTIGLETAATQRIVVGGNIDNVSWKQPSDVAVGDGTVDFAYGGASGTSIVEIGGVTASEELRAVDDQSGAVLDVAISDASGRVNFSSLTNSEHDVLIEQNNPPKLSNANPTGGQSSDPSQLSVDVSDQEIAKEDVDVYVDYDGSQIKSTTISSNQTVTASISSPDGGQHSWEVNAQDGAGQWTNKSYSFKVPDRLYIRNVSAPETNITNANVTVRFFASDRIVTKTSGSTGYVNLTNLPVDEQMIVAADASGYYGRTSLVDSIYEQNSGYLLNNTIASNEVRFALTDQTGNFPEDDSEVLVERALRINGTTNWEIVSGDEFGVAGHTTKLEDGVRYRIKVRNNDGDTRIQGEYVAAASETIDLEIGSLEIGPDVNESYAWDAAYSNVSSNEEVSVSYNDPDSATDNLTVKIYERGNESNTVYDQTTNGPYGNFSLSEPVPSGPDAWVVEWSGYRNGEQISGQRIVGPGATVGTPLGQFWTSFIGATVLVIVGGLFGGVRAELGAVAVSLMGGMMWFLGWLPPSVGAGAVILAMGLAILNMYASDEPGVPS